MGTYQYQYTFLIISRSILLRLGNVSEKIVFERVKNTFYIQQLFFSKIGAFYEIMLKNIV